MIVTAYDSVNVSVVMDLVHARLIVELLRSLDMDAHKGAVETVLLIGIEATELDAVVASGSFISVVSKVIQPIAPRADGGIAKADGDSCTASARTACRRSKGWVN